MKTEALIQALVADVRPVRRLPRARQRCVNWLGLGAVLVVASASALGLRPDLAAKAQDVVFLGENAALLLVCLLAARGAFQLSVPEEARSASTYAQPLLALGLAAGLVVLRGHSATVGTLEPELSHGLSCIQRSAGLGALPVLAGWAMLRRAAPLQQRWVGLFLFLSAFSLATIGTQVLCNADGALHLLLWHYLPLLLAGLAGAALGEVAFRKRASPWPLRPGATR
ncbi:MAG: hypothetical protein RL033_1228 [Pseudomonadota bacterium]